MHAEAIKAMQHLIHWYVDCELDHHMLSLSHVCQRVCLTILMYIRHVGVIAVGSNQAPCVLRERLPSLLPL